MARNAIPKYIKYEEQYSEAPTIEKIDESKIKLSDEDKSWTTFEKTLMILSVAFSAFFVVGVFYVSNVHSQANNQLHDTQTTIVQEKQKKENLMQELTELKSSDRLKSAVEKSGLSGNEENIRMLTK